MDEEQVRKLWAQDDWPPLPRQAMLRLRPDRIDLEGEHSRDFGEVPQRPEPGEQVRRRLETFRRRLQGRFSFCEAVAFSHP